MTRRILLTGATRGIGRATALELAEPGTALVLTGRSTTARPDKRMPGTLEETAALARERGAQVLTIAADFTDLEQVTGVADRILAEYGGCDVLINNAAISYLGPFADVPPRRWVNALNVDLLAPVTLMHALLPAMITQGSGIVVNLGSGAAQHDIVPQLPYSVAKLGLERITTSLGDQVPESVTVTCLRIDEVVVTEAVQQTAPQVVQPDSVRSEDFARVIAWVLSHPAGLHGQTLDFHELRRRGAFAP